MSTRDSDNDDAGEQAEEQDSVVGALLLEGQLSFAPALPDSNSRPATAFFLACAALLLILFAFGGFLFHGGAGDRDGVGPALQMPSGRPLKLLLISDVHYGEGEDQWWGPAQDANTTRVVERVLDAERPDFVVFLGDIVTGENLVNATNATGYLRHALEPLLQRGIPFASTYGNHDVSNSLPRAAMYEYERRQKLSHTQRSDPLSMPGVTNYVLRFRSADSFAGRPAVQLVFLDSNGVTGLVNRTGVPEVNWVTKQQVEFLKSVLSSGEGIPTYVFVHIPPPKISDLNEGFQGCVGLHEEPRLDVQGEDEGLWDTLQSSANVLAVFFGHNHGTGWCCPTGRYPPQTACFARHTGYGGYGDWPRGARVVLMDERHPFVMNSWVRMENGSKVDNFS